VGFSEPARRFGWKGREAAGGAAQAFGTGGDLEGGFAVERNAKMVT